MAGTDNGLTTGDGEAGESETEIKPSLTVSRNGSELSVTKAVSRIIHTFVMQVPRPSMNL